MVTKREQKLVATSNMLNLLIKLGLDKSVINYVFLRVESEKMALTVERMMASLQTDMYRYPIDLLGNNDQDDQKTGILVGLQKWLRNL